MAGHLLDVRNLSVRFHTAYGPVDAVRNVSWHVDRGETLAILGESGSGKSTILRAVAGLIPGWSGRIAVEGKPVAGLRRDRAFQKTVQMVFQDPYASLHPRHSVDRVLSETLALQGLGDVDRRMTRLLEDVGLGRGFRFLQPLVAHLRPLRRCGM